MFTCDPERTRAVIDRQLQDTRTIADAIGLAMESIFAERAHLWPALMRWEDTTFVLWSRQAALTHEERRQDADERAASRNGAPFLRDPKSRRPGDGALDRILDAGGGGADWGGPWDASGTNDDSRFVEC